MFSGLLFLVFSVLLSDDSRFSREDILLTSESVMVSSTIVLPNHVVRLSKNIRLLWSSCVLRVDTTTLYLVTNFGEITAADYLSCDPRLTTDRSSAPTHLFSDIL